MTMIKATRLGSAPIWSLAIDCGAVSAVATVRETGAGYVVRPNAAPCLRAIEGRIGRALPEIGGTFPTLDAAVDDVRAAMAAGAP